MEKRQFNLSEDEVKELILKYESELKKLDFQSYRLKASIADLQGQLGNTKPAPAADKKTRAEKTQTSEAVAPAKKRGRPRKNAAEVAIKPVESKPEPKKRGRKKIEKPAVEKKAAEPKKRGRKATVKAETKPAKTTGRKARVTKGYRLSDWDEFLINTLHNSQQVMVTSAFIDAFKTQRPDLVKKMDAQDLGSKVQRTIHKLANTRKLLAKTQYPGKGFAYGLPEWKNEKGLIADKYFPEKQN